MSSINSIAHSDLELLPSPHFDSSYRTFLCHPMIWPVCLHFQNIKGCCLCYLSVNPVSNCTSDTILYMQKVHIGANQMRIFMTLVIYYHCQLVHMTYVIYYHWNVVLLASVILWMNFLQDKTHLCSAKACNTTNGSMLVSPLISI